MSVVEIIEIGKFFPVILPNGEAEGVPAVQDVSVTIGDGEFVSIVGPSGCGKSTLLDLVAGLQIPSEGMVKIDGETVLEAPPVNRWELRNYKKRYRFKTPFSNHFFRNRQRFSISMVFQDHSVYPWQTALKNVMFPLRIAKISSAEREQRARKVLDTVGLGGYENKYPYQLSGGMRQRVALARAMVTEPKLLLMDEPFGLLDEFTRENLQNELDRIRRAQKLTVLYVTHDIEEAVYLSDRILILAPNPGTVRNVFDLKLSSPRHRSDPNFRVYVERIHSIFRSESWGETMDFQI